MTVNYSPITIPFVGGLESETHSQALQPPALAVARDVEFDEAGALTTRKPYESLSTSILGGGSLSDIRKVVAYGDELLCFTKTALYSWSASDSAWVLKSTYLAPKVEERSVFVRTSEQTQCDRAELGNVVVYAWVDVPSASSTGVYVGAVDKTTGAVLLAPTAVGTSSSRPRLLALTTKVVLLYLQGTDLKAVAIDPGSLASSVAAAATTITANCNTYYDAVASSSNIWVACRRAVTTSYDVHSITEALAVTSSTKARTCDLPIALAYEPNTSRLQICRGVAATGVVGDLLNSSTLADVFTATTLLTGLTGGAVHITAAFRSVTDSSLYRCYVYASIQEDTSSASTSYNWVDTNNTVGLATTTSFCQRLALASRAFDHDGSIYVWLTFALPSTAGSTGFRTSEQNVYALMRDDKTPVAKAGYTQAGGYTTPTGYLGGVASTGTGVYSWCGTERRVIQLGLATSATGYSARAPRDVTVTFDSDDARRCVRLGETLYISGGQVCQYDGEGITEVGFHVYPFRFTLTDDGAGHSLEAGTYTYKATFRWDNARGERERSTTATTAEITLSAASHRVGLNMSTLPVTLKTSSRTPPAVEVWRTLVDPTIDSPFYLVTDQDPGQSGAAENPYLVNDTTTGGIIMKDDIPDSTLASKESNPENGGVLENLAPPPASIITANQERIFLAGVPNQPYTVWYSKLRGTGEIAAFHDGLTVDVPPEGGPITALGLLDETLVAFCETAVYMLPGEGFDNTSGGLNYGPARRLSSDVGCTSADLVGVTPAGLVFKSLKGWYIVSRGGSLEYIGGPVKEFDSDSFYAVHTVEKQHQLRCLSSSRVLVYDYRRNQWAEWTETGGRGATLWGNRYVYCTGSAVKRERLDWTGCTFGLDVETPWIDPTGLKQGYARIRQAMVLGEYRSACQVRIRVAYNHNESDADGPTWVDDKYKVSSPTTVGGPLVIRHGLMNPKGKAFKFRITAYSASSESLPPAGEALKLTALTLDIGAKRGMYRGLGASRKQ